MPINSVFAFCNQPGFLSRQNLHKISIMVLQNYLGVFMIYHVCCFQVFQLTALVMMGPSELHPVFTVSLNGVAVSHEEMNGPVVSVQDFVRLPLFTQRNFFSDTGTTMLNTAVAATDAVRHSSEFEPWGAIGVGADPMIADLKSCQMKVVLRGKAVKDTRERWFGAKTVASPTVGEVAPCTTVRISDVVEMGDNQYIKEHNELGLLVAVDLLHVLERVRRGECQ